MRILITAKQYGPANTLLSPAREMLKRGHCVTIYATGNDNETKGFQDLQTQRVAPTGDDFSKLVQDYDVVLTGLSGFTSPDGHFIRAALSQNIPVIGVADQDGNYIERLGKEPQYLPTVIALMSGDCKKTLENQLNQETGREAVKRSRIIGWPAFDRYANLRENFESQIRTKLLQGIGINPDGAIYVHFTQNMDPDCLYMSQVPRSREYKTKEFQYEMRVTKAAFQAASDLGIKLVVKPHPGEKYEINHTKELTDSHGFTFIPASECNTQQLMLAANSVTAGRSTCLTEATLLDKNTGGLIPEMGNEWVSPFPPMKLRAIPYTQEWQGIKNIMNQVTSNKESVVRKLAEDRKKFSVDGNASNRLANLVESLAK